MVVKEKTVREGYKTELGAIPVEWEVLKVDSIADKIVGGGTPSRENPNYFKGTIPWVTVKDMDGSFYSNISQEHINEIAIKESSTNLIDEYQVIIATRIALGRGFINTSPVAINQDLKALYLNKELIQPEYFLYWYLSQKELVESMGSGSTVKGIRLEQLRALWVPIPELKEQQKIAEILSTVDEQIENTKQLIEKTKELKKGLMQHLLTKGIGHTEFKQTELGEIPVEWDITTVGSLADFIGSGITPKGGSNVYQSEGIVFIRSQNVHFMGLQLEDVAFISNEIDEKMKRTRVFENDVLLNITGASIGRCTVVPSGFSKANVNQHVCIIRTKKELYPYFLNAYLSSPFGQQQIFKQQLGQTREGLNFQQIREFKIVIPSLVEQQKIAEILSAVDEQFERYEKEKAKYTELKKGLMQQLLTGKIRVTV